MATCFALPGGSAYRGLRFTATGRVSVEFHLANGYRFTPAERLLIEGIVADTVADVRRLLPALPRDLVVRVRASGDVIPETGQSGSAFPPQVIAWNVDPRSPVEAYAETSARRPDLSSSSCLRVFVARVRRRGLSSSSCFRVFVASLLRALD